MLSHPLLTSIDISFLIYELTVNEIWSCYWQMVIKLFLFFQSCKLVIWLLKSSNLSNILLILIASCLGLKVEALWRCVWGWWWWVYILLNWVQCLVSFHPVDYDWTIHPFHNLISFVYVYDSSIALYKLYSYGWDLRIDDVQFCYILGTLL